MKTSITTLEKRGALKRILRVSELFAVGYGDLGSSIYYALGITALYALGATPISLGLAGIVFVCTALTYAEMTSLFHESGGSASFARHAFNDLISFIAGWGLLLDYIVTIAISAFAIAPYLAIFYAPLRTVELQIGFTLGIIATLFVVNLFGVRQSTRISLLLALFTIVTQVVIIIIGAGWLFDFSFIMDHIRIGGPDLAWSPSWHDFWKGTAMAMVAYTGIESIAQLSAETKSPSRTVPRAVALTMLVLVVMYLGISLVALSAISPQELSTTYLMDPIAGIVKALPFGAGILAPWVGLLAALLLFVASNAGLLGASRLSFNMGEYYQLPRLFYRVHPRFRTPHWALAVFAVLACLVVLASRGHMTFLADLYNFGAMLGFFFAHLSLIVMRIKKPELHRPFRLRLNLPIFGYQIPLTAIVGCLATAGVWVLVVLTKPEGRYLGLSWMLIGTVMYLLYRRKKRLKPTGSLSIEKVTVEDYTPWHVSNILVATRGSIETEAVQMACEQAKLHNAKVTALNVLEVPESMPLDAKLQHRVESAQAALKGAEAIAREYDVPIELKLLRARAVVDAIIDELKTGHYDLLVIGSMQKSTKRLGATTDKISRHSSCRILICSRGEKFT